MINAPLLSDEMLRLRALKSFQLLDTPPEKEFDEITQLAVSLCQTPIGFISLVDEQREWFKSRLGFDLSETTRNLACSTDILSKEAGITVVENAAEDVRFRNHPLVSGEPHMVFYACVPLLDEEQHAIGFLGVMDRKERQVSSQQLQALKVLAGMCMEKMLARRKRLTAEQNKQVQAKRLDLEKEKLYRELSAKVNALQQYNYIVSHNLRGPIANILGLANLMLNMPEHLSEEEKNLYMQKMYEATVKMDTVVKDLTQILGFQHIREAKRDRIDFQEMIQGTLASLQLFIEEAQADIEVRIQPSLGSFTSIRSYIQSILYNLISNAIKYRVRNRQLKVLVRVSKEEDELVLAVKDNGQGINLQLHEKELFGLYKRFNPYVEGRGLGLYMTKMQVNSLGGSIEVESREGMGTTFTVRLKAKGGEAAVASEEAIWIEKAC